MSWELLPRVKHRHPVFFLSRSWWANEKIVLFQGLVYIQVQCCGQEKGLLRSARHGEAGSLPGGGGMEKESCFLPPAGVAEAL